MDKKPTLILAACCGPCATVAIEQLSSRYNIIIAFWGNNLESLEEYNKRLEALKIVNEKLNNNAPMRVEDYKQIDFNNLDISKENEKTKFVIDNFQRSTLNFETDPEGSHRCRLCYFLRLQNAVKIADKIFKENSKYEYICFATTLSTSPHKDSAMIDIIGGLAQDTSPHNTFNGYPRTYVSYLPTNFKGNGGFNKSVVMSKKLCIYRQTFCGCKYSNKN
ncbi:MAG: epoxyqueuosine reductase QueH [Firmicutes bacterium]|nr:epoxyqueuosine reductase QueH [Bacillota bacterium]